MNTETKFIDYLNTLPESSEKSEMIKYLQNQLKFKNQTLHFKDKFNVVMSFIKFLKTMCENINVSIYGSFTRNIIEKIFMDTSDIGYGDPINHDIDMVIYKSKNDFDKDIKYFSDFISLLRIVSNTNSYDFNFSGFKIADVIETTLKKIDLTNDNSLNKTFLVDIPHYVIILIKDNIKIKLDVLCYKNESENDTWQNEFNVNSLSLTDNGIFVNNTTNIMRDSYGMFETIYSIMNKTATCNLPFYSLFNDFEFKLRTEKVKILNQVVWFFTNRMKILSLGYNNIFSDMNFFDYIIEKEEDCQITGNCAPYIKIKLACTHYISIMGLAGIINIRSSEWTESIKCPFCRHDLNCEMIDVLPPKIKIPAQPVKEIVEIDKYEKKNDLFSEENILYISNLLKNQKLPGFNREDIITMRNITDLEHQQNRIQPAFIEPVLITPRRTHTLVGRARTQEEYRELNFN